MWCVPDPEEPSHPITARLWSLSAAFHARLAYDLASVGLTLAEFRLVGEVMRSPEGLRQGELAARLGGGEAPREERRAHSRARPA